MYNYVVIMTTSISYDKNSYPVHIHVLHIILTTLSKSNTCITRGLSINLPNYNYVNCQKKITYARKKTQNSFQIKELVTILDLNMPFYKNWYYIFAEKMAFAFKLIRYFINQTFYIMLCCCTYNGRKCMSGINWKVFPQFLWLIFWGKDTNWQFWNKSA